MDPWFIATERFLPGDDSWESYVRWSGLTQLTELISLDPELCPSLIGEWDASYEHRMVGGPIKDPLPFGLFTDLDFLRNEVAHVFSCELFSSCNNLWAIFRLEE